MTGKDSKLKMFHETVTVQGLEQIYDSNSGPLRRIVWFFIFTGGLAFTTFNIYKQVLLYMSKPINVRVDEILGTSLPFPTITICNINTVNKTFVEQVGVSVDALSLLFPYKDFVEDHPNMTVYELSDSVSHIFENPQASMILLAPSEDATVLKCDWEKKPCGLDKFTNILTNMGLCYSFNANGTRYARNSGRAHGLRLVLNVHTEEYTRSMDDYIGTGFMVAVHPPEVPPIMSETGIAVVPGHQHFMGINVKMHHSSEAVSGCGSKKLDLLDANYSREACKLECMGQDIYKDCNCMDMSVMHNVRVCGLVEYSNCYLPTYEKYLQRGIGCESECPEPCSYNTFTTQHSSSPLSKDYITQYTKAKGQTEEHWRRNLVILEVYLNSMTYEHMEKQLGYEILDLFCDIGGALGLLLGASILTVLEVVDYLCLRTLNKLFVGKKPKQIDVQPVK